MLSTWHNGWPTLDDDRIEITNIDPKSKLWQKILTYVQQVSAWVYTVIVPRVIIKRWDTTMFQIKPDAFSIFTGNWDDFRVTWIEECVDPSIYKIAA